MIVISDTKPMPREETVLVEGEKHTIAVNSINTGVLAKVKEAFDTIFPDTIWTVIAMEIADQDFSIPAEAEAALEVLKQTKESMRTTRPDASYYVSLQHATEDVCLQLIESLWCLICTSKGASSFGTSPRVPLPRMFLSNRRLKESYNNTLQFHFGTSSNYTTAVSKGTLSLPNQVFLATIAALLKHT